MVLLSLSFHYSKMSLKALPCLNTFFKDAVAAGILPF